MFRGGFEPGLERASQRGFARSYNNTVYCVCNGIEPIGARPACEIPLIAASGESRIVAGWQTATERNTLDALGFEALRFEALREVCGAVETKVSGAVVTKIHGAMGINLQSVRIAGRPDRRSRKLRSGRSRNCGTTRIANPRSGAPSARTTIVRWVA
jgi:hypothetical protein